MKAKRIYSFLTIIAIIVVVTLIAGTLRGDSSEYILTAIWFQAGGVATAFTYFIGKGTI